MKLSEKQIQNQCLEYALHVKGCEFWQVNTVGVFDKAKGCYRLPKTPYRVKGMPDTIGFYKGKALFWEFKTPERRKKLSQEQEEFFDIASDHGQDVRIITSLEEFITGLSEL